MKSPHNPIHLEEKILLGGVDQWISIHGSDKNNPLVLLLHGGPGEPLPRALVQEFLPELEDLFVVVNWHQRGAGRSFSGKIPLESMTPKQLVADTIDLTEILLEKFNRKKLLLMGGSWGSFLGISALSKSPHLYAAYVGTGQVVHQDEGERISYDFVLKKAQQAHDHKTLKILRKIGRPPYPEKKHLFSVWKQRAALRKYKGSIYDESNVRKLTSFSRKGFSFFEKIKMIRGNIFSEKTVGIAFRKINFFHTVPSVDVPVFFMLGEHDWQTPTTLAKQYCYVLKAPKKEVHIFKNSAHLPPFEEPERFMRIVRERVYPLMNRVYSQNNDTYGITAVPLTFTKKPTD